MKEYTLGEWLRIWLKHYVEPSGLAVHTKMCYNRAVQAVPAELSLVDMKFLSPLDCLLWIQDVAQVYPRAAQLDRVMLSRALKVAAKLHLTNCVLDADTCPQVVHKPQKTAVLTLPELRRYVIAAANTDVAPVLLLCCCGLRRGEALGARRCDLSADGILTVQVQRLDGLTLSPVKTCASVRRIALPPIVADCLRRQPLTLSGLFCEASPNRVYRAHRALLERLQLPAVTLHGLRHSVASAAVLSGVPVKSVQGWLGHASYAITADLYANHLPDVSSACERLF